MERRVIEFIRDYYPEWPSLAYSHNEELALGRATVMSHGSVYWLSHDAYRDVLESGKIRVCSETAVTVGKRSFVIHRYACPDDQDNRIGRFLVYPLQTRGEYLAMSFFLVA